MSQLNPSVFPGGLVLPDAARPVYRQNLSDALQAIASNFEGVTAPLNPLPCQWWADTGSIPKRLMIRNSANTSWVFAGFLDVDNLGLAPASLGLAGQGRGLVVWDDVADDFRLVQGATIASENVEVRNTLEIATTQYTAFSANTTPAITQGYRYLSASITPQFDNGKIEIEASVNVYSTNGNSNKFAIALFREPNIDTAPLRMWIEAVEKGSVLSLKHIDSLTSTQEFSYHVQVGAIDNTANFVLNGVFGYASNSLGTTLASSIQLTERVS